MRHPLTHVKAGQYRTRTARAERSEGNQSPSGALISARFPTHRNVYRDDCRFVVDGTGLEQHGHAAGGATNTPVGCLLVRGSQRLGMSTKKDVARPFGLGMWWAVQNSNSNKQRQGITVALCPAFVLHPPILCVSGQSLRTSVHGRYARTQEKGQVLIYNSSLLLCNMIYSRQHNNCE